MKKKCCVIGLGYIGLPTSIVTASAGFEVIGVDTNHNIIEDLNKGFIHIIEPNLKEQFEEITAKKLFRAQNTPCIANVFIIAVPTPFKKGANDIPCPDISFVLNAVESIIPFLKKGNLIILESTSPVGTTEQIANKIFKETSLTENELKIAYCPERVIPGNILKEIRENDRVIGGINMASAQEAKDFYSSFSKGSYKLTNTRTAELVKLTENSFRDVNIAFANELSMICSTLDIEVNELIELANCHPRVNILKPSPGVGGHCIAVDPWFIVSKVPSQSNLIKTARKVNNEKTQWVINEIKNKRNTFQDNFQKEPIIGCLGLTFKPDVDDIRESSALKVVKELLADDLNIICCDPMIKNLKGIEIREIDFLLANSDILVVLVSHSKFLNLNYGKSIVLDFCGISYRG